MVVSNEKCQSLAGNTRLPVKFPRALLLDRELYKSGMPEKMYWHTNYGEKENITFRGGRENAQVIVGH
jgi:hypothetical protein